MLREPECDGLVMKQADSIYLVQLALAFKSTLLTQLLPIPQKPTPKRFIAHFLQRHIAVERQIFDRTKAVFEYFSLPFDAEPPPM
jgi:hypothetical protein